MLVLPRATPCQMSFSKVTKFLQSKLQSNHQKCNSCTNAHVSWVCDRKESWKNIGELYDNNVDLNAALFMTKKTVFPSKGGVQIISSHSTKKREELKQCRILRMTRVNLEHFGNKQISWSRLSFGIFCRF